MTINAGSLAADFRAYACDKLSQSMAQITRCVNLLSLEQVWHRPNNVSNAIGNLVLHLSGNVRLWIVASLGGEVFHRNRQAEFDQREPISKDEILAKLQSTVERAQAVIRELTAEQLSEHVVIQGYDVTKLAAVFHVVEHFSLHAGQIVYATKILINRDLSAYNTDGKRVDGQNEQVP